MRALYAGEITMTDAWLGRFLGRMEELALMETTLLVLLSDHGACLSEHNDTGKPCWALYPELTDTVFMMRHPQGKGGDEFAAEVGDVGDHTAQTEWEAVEKCRNKSSTAFSDGLE
jgi:arylsulfatase A-like enzyme